MMRPACARNRKRNHSLVETSRVDGVKAPLQTPRCAPESSSAFVASSWPSWISFFDKGRTRTTTFTHSPSFFRGTPSASPCGGIVAASPRRRVPRRRCPVGLPARRPGCVRARVRAAAAPPRRLVGLDGGPRADGQRNTKACGFGEFGGGTPPGRRRLRDVDLAPEIRPPGAARALSSRRARAADAAPSVSEPPPTPFWGGLFIRLPPGSARTRSYPDQNGFSSRFANLRTTCDRGPTVGRPARRISLLSICTARAAAWFGPRRASVRGLNTPSARAC